MGGVEPFQDPSPVQEIVDQGIDRDQLHADFAAIGANLSGADQNVGQRHGEHFVRNAVDIAQWLNQGRAHCASGSAALWSFTWSSRSSIQATKSSSATSRMNRYRL